METTKYKEGADGNYVLVGHSLGGYLSAQYNLRFPEKMTKLILLSPVGVPQRPEGFTIENLVKR